MTTGCENAMNFCQHAFRRKCVMLHDVRVRREVERIAGEGKRLAPEIAFAIIHAKISDGSAKRRRVHSVIEGRDAEAELRRVNREGSELRANIDQLRSLIRGSVRLEVPEDSDLSAAVPQGVADPRREIRRDSRVAGNRLENLREAFERGALARNSISTWVCIGECHENGILHYPFPTIAWRLRQRGHTGSYSRVDQNNSPPAQNSIRQP